MARDYTKSSRRQKKEVAQKVAQNRRGKRELPLGSLSRHPKTHGWYLHIRWPGEEKRSSIPMVPNGKKYATKQKGVALTIAKKLIKNKLKVSIDYATAGRGMEGWIHQFERHGILSTRSETSGQPKFNANVCRRFVKDMEIRVPWDITADAIEEYFIRMRTRTDKKGNPKPAARKTVVNHQNALRKFVKFLLRKGELDANPFDHVEPQTSPSKPPRRIPKSVVDQLVDKARESEIDGIYPAVMIARHCGLRLGEIMALTWASIERGRKWAIVVGDKDPTKSDSWRVVPVSPALKKVLAELPQGELSDPLLTPRHKWTWIRQFKKLSRNLPVFGELAGSATGNQWHALRAFRAMEMAKAGATPFELMSYFGWTSLHMPLKYINVAQAAGRE